MNNDHSTQMIKSWSFTARVALAIFFVILASNYIYKISQGFRLEVFAGSGMYGADEFLLTGTRLENTSWKIVMGELQTNSRQRDLTTFELESLAEYARKSNLLLISSTWCGVFSQCTPDEKNFKVKIYIGGRANSFSCAAEPNTACAKASENLLHELHRIFASP